MKKLSNISENRGAGNKHEYVYDSPHMTGKRDVKIKSDIGMSTFLMEKIAISVVNLVLMVAGIREYEIDIVIRKKRG